MDGAPSVGDAIPAGDVHGISVQLPKWEHTVGWATRNPEVLSRMKTGYPRFFIPRVVDELARRLLILFCSNKKNSPQELQGYKDGSKLGLILQTGHFARECREFLIKKGVPTNAIVVFSFAFDGFHELNEVDAGRNGGGSSLEKLLHVVSYPAEYFQFAKAFWQHTGFGISSRCAEYSLKRLDAGAGSINVIDEEYLHACKAATTCKAQLRERLANIASTSASKVDVKDVFLYPTGMSAISHTAVAIAGLKGNETCKAAIFGFLYVDTFKVLTTIYDFDYILYGHASPSDLEDLECELARGNSIDALYLEFPGNPLLQSPDLARIFSLAKQYHFLVIVDDTVGTTVNLDLLDSCDIICTSLSKMFSGACNVMGGSVTLNPNSFFYKRMSEAMNSQFADTYFAHDAIVMEANSRDFAERVSKASENTEAIYQMLAQHRTVTQVYYPRGSTSQHIYDSFKRRGRGYGFLLSATFISPACAIAFHDALHVAKGPSLGTNFTLACAYTLLAHAKELEWAAEFGVVEHLVRISVGLEDRNSLVEIVEVALEAADEARSNQSH